MATVRNINGTSDRKPDEFDSWKDFWESRTGKSFDNCSCIGCSNKAEIGGHVQKESANSRDFWYIAPLCQNCNHKTEPFSVVDYNLERINPYD